MFDPRTGLRAIAILPSGKVVWPIAGGDDDDPADGQSDDSQPGDDTPPKDLAAEVEKWKKLARKHESDADKLRRAAKQAEDADKSEVERLTDRATSAEQRATAAELKASRLEIAAAKGLPIRFASRLQGATTEELEADADDLLKELKPSDTQGAPAPASRPREALRSGSAPDTEPEENDPAKLAAMVPRP